MANSYLHCYFGNWLSKIESISAHGHFMSLFFLLYFKVCFRKYIYSRMGHRLIFLPMAVSFFLNAFFPKCFFMTDIGLSLRQKIDDIPPKYCVIIMFYKNSVKHCNEGDPLFGNTLKYCYYKLKNADLFENHFSIMRQEI